MPSVNVANKDVNYFPLMQKDFFFEDGVNILWGRNSIGKSLLMKALAINAMFKYQYKDGGWSEVMKADELKNNRYFNLIDVEWSGLPAFYIPFKKTLHS